MINNKHYILNFKELGDARGGLAVINSNEEVPFNIARVFYNYNTGKDVIRGDHANRNSCFVMVSLAGACIVEVDDGKSKTEYILDDPHKGLYVGKMLWKVMKNFSKDNVLLILSDCKYDEKEYIRVYDAFLEEVE